MLELKASFMLYIKHSEYQITESHFQGSSGLAFFQYTAA